MDPKYFILILFCGHMNNTVFAETEAMTTEKQPQPTLFTSPRPQVSANSQNTTGNPLGQSTQFNNMSSRQSMPTAKVIAGKLTLAANATSEKPAAHTPAGQPLASNTTRQPTPTANSSSQQTALPVFTSARQLQTSAPASSRQSPPSVYTSSQQLSSVHTSSKTPVPPTVPNLSTQPTSIRSTPGFYLESPSTTPHETPSTISSESLGAIIAGTILLFLLVAIIIIVPCKCLRKPVLNDENWAGRSPFADGETPDICLDNFRENEAPTKRTSIISLMTWKPSKSTLLADDLEVKLFESTEHTEEFNSLKTEKIKDQVNGTSEESAGGSTIGTAVSSSDDTDLVPPPPLLDLEGQESYQSDKPTVTIVSPLPNDSINLPPPLDGLDQVCEDHNSEFKQPFLPPPDSLNLPGPPGDCMKTPENSNSEVQCQEFSILPSSDQDLNEALPPPPTEML